MDMVVVAVTDDAQGRTRSRVPPYRVAVWDDAPLERRVRLFEAVEISRGQPRDCGAVERRAVAFSPVPTRR